MRAGQFWVFIGFSLSIMATILLDQTPTQSSALNAAAVGLILLVCAILEMSGLHLWMDRLQMLLGLWLAASVLVLPGAAPGPTLWAHVVLGSALAVIGAWHWWRDRAASPKGKQPFGSGR